MASAATQRVKTLLHPSHTAAGTKGVEGGRTSCAKAMRDAHNVVIKEGLRQAGVHPGLQAACCELHFLLPEGAHAWVTEPVGPGPP
jgi:hypothetical protein